MKLFDPSGAAIPSTDETVRFFEHCLEQARAGRVLFVVASVGVVGDPVAAPRPQRPLVLLTDAHTDAPVPDTAPTPRKFEVIVGTSIGHELAANLHHVALTSAFADVVKGVQAAQTAIATELLKRQPAGEERGS